MEKLSELVSELDLIFNDVKVNLAKFLDGNKAAGRRARLALQKLKSHSQSTRVEIQNEKSAKPKQEL